MASKNQRLGVGSTGDGPPSAISQRNGSTIVRLEESLPCGQQTHFPNGYQGQNFTQQNRPRALIEKIFRLSHLIFAF